MGLRRLNPVIMVIAYFDADTGPDCAQSRRARVRLALAFNPGPRHGRIKKATPARASPPPPGGRCRRLPAGPHRKDSFPIQHRHVQYDCAYQRPSAPSW